MPPTVLTTGAGGNRERDSAPSASTSAGAVISRTSTRGIPVATATGGDGDGNTSGRTSRMVFSRTSLVMRETSGGVNRL
ncbi:hypothetical protein HDU76_008133, partial [Blyttiomyces sp. JEL0837]